MSTVNHPSINLCVNREGSGEVNFEFVALLSQIWKSCVCSPSLSSRGLHHKTFTDYFLYEILKPNDLKQCFLFKGRNYSYCNAKFLLNLRRSCCREKCYIDLTDFSPFCKKESSKFYRIGPWSEQQRRI